MATTTIDFSEVLTSPTRPPTATPTRSPTATPTQPTTGIDFTTVLTGRSIDEPVIDAGPPGIQDKSLRYQMARASTLPEKLVELREHYGKEADLALKVFDGGKPTLAFREHDKDKWKKVDKDFLDMDRHEFVRDLIDFAGEDLESIIGEVIAFTPVGRFGKGVSLIGTAIKAGTGATAGEFAKEGIEVVRGKQQETLGEIRGRATTKGAFAAGFAPVGEVVTRKALDFIRGGSQVGLRNRAREAISIAKTEGLPVPPTHYLVTQPWIQKLGGQSEAAFARIGDYVTNARIASERVLRRLAESPGVTGNVVADLARLEKVAANRVERFQREVLIERGRGVLSAKGKRLAAAKTDEVAENLIRSLAEWDVIKRTQIDTAYKKARLHGDPDFDLEPLREVAESLLGGQSARRFKDVIDPKTGEVIGEELVESVAVPQMSAETIRVLKEIAETSRLERKGEFSPTDQLNYWREVLADNMVVAVDEPVRKANKLARTAWRAVGDVLDNPANKGNPDFTKAWKAARKIANDRFTVWEKNVIQVARSTEEPHAFIRRLFENQDRDVAKALRSGIPTKRWREIQEAFLGELISDPVKLTSRLDLLDEGFRKAMLNEKDFAALVKLGKGFDDLKALGIEDAVRRQADLGKQFGELISRGDVVTLKPLAELIKQSGGKTSKLGINVRASILQDIYNKALEVAPRELEEGVEAGARFLDAGKLKKIIDEYKDKGLLELIETSDLANLERLAHLEEFYQPVGKDVGGQLAAAGFVGRLRSLTGAAFRTALEFIGVGRLLTTPAGRRILLGSGKKQLSFQRKMAMLWGAIGVIAEDVKSSEAEIAKLTAYVQ